jgi:hypothetical protein
MPGLAKISSAGAVLKAIAVCQQTSDPAHAEWDLGRTHPGITAVHHKRQEQLAIRYSRWILKLTQTPTVQKTLTAVRPAQLLPAPIARSTACSAVLPSQQKWPQPVASLRKTEVTPVERVTPAQGSGAHMPTGPYPPARTAQPCDSYCNQPQPSVYCMQATTPTNKLYIRSRPRP